MPRDPFSSENRSLAAWNRFRRLMQWTALAAIAAIIVAFVYLAVSGVDLRIHMLIATAAGVGFSVMLGGALMGLVFLSSGSGHDEDAS